MYLYIGGQCSPPNWRNAIVSSFVVLSFFLSSFLCCFMRFIFMWSTFNTFQQENLSFASKTSIFFRGISVDSSFRCFKKKFQMLSSLNRQILLSWFVHWKLATRIWVRLKKAILKPTKKKVFGTFIACAAFIAAFLLFNSDAVCFYPWAAFKTGSLGFGYACTNCNVATRVFYTRLLFMIVHCLITMSFLSFFLSPIVQSDLMCGFWTSI